MMMLECWNKLEIGRAIKVRIGSIFSLETFELTYMCCIIKRFINARKVLQLWKSFIY